MKNEFEIIRTFALQHNPARTEIWLVGKFRGRNIYAARRPLKNRMSKCGEPDLYSISEIGKPFRLSFDEELEFYRTL